jgi:hypothetical protein
MQPLPTNGYYLIAEAGQVWSSKRAVYVDGSDEEYLKYADRYFTPSYPTAASLTAYLSRYNIVGPVAG